MTQEHVIWTWEIPTFVWNITSEEFADLYERSWEDDPLRWLAQAWTLKEQDPLAWLSSLNKDQALRIQEKLETEHARNYGSCPCKEWVSQHVEIVHVTEGS